MIVSRRRLHPARTPPNGVSSHPRRDKQTGRAEEARVSDRADAVVLQALETTLAAGSGRGSLVVSVPNRPDSESGGTAISELTFDVARRRVAMSSVFLSQQQPAGLSSKVGHSSKDGAAGLSSTPSVSSVADDVDIYTQLPDDHSTDEAWLAVDSPGFTTGLGPLYWLHGVRSATQLRDNAETYAVTIDAARAWRDCTETDRESVRASFADAGLDPDSATIEGAVTLRNGKLAVVEVALPDQDDRPVVR